MLPAITIAKGRGSSGRMVHSVPAKRLSEHELLRPPVASKEVVRRAPVSLLRAQSVTADIRVRPEPDGLFLLLPCLRSVLARAAETHFST
jgi:hypothetical protein